MSGKPPKPGFTKYLGAAFSWHWNMLAFGAAVVFAFLSGHPDIFLPLFGAAEIAYLGLLSTHPKFRKSVDARKYAGRGVGVTNISTDDLMRQMRSGLKPEAWRKYEASPAHAIGLRT